MRISLLLIAAALVGMELLYFKVADKYNIIDKPNQRSSHTRITLRGGGIIFFLGALCFFVVSGWQYPWFIFGLSLISMVSFADDVHSVPNRVRIAVQFTAMLLMFHQIGILNIEDWWIVIAALIVCTGIINAYNFMDGINGITGAYSLAVLIPLAIVNQKLDFVNADLIWIAGISALVFCFFNFRKKAKLFAGDVGSVSMAFILLFIWGKLVISTGNVWYLTFFGVYGVDSVLTICHRLMLRENIFQPHRKHAYQIMANELKIPHTRVAFLYFAIQLLLSLGVIYLPVNEWAYFGLSMLVLGLTYIAFMSKFYHLHAQKA